TLPDLAGAIGHLEGWVLEVEMQSSAARDGQQRGLVPMLLPVVLGPRDEAVVAIEVYDHQAGHLASTDADVQTGVDLVPGTDGGQVGRAILRSMRGQRGERMLARTLALRIPARARAVSHNPR